MGVKTTQCPFKEQQSLLRRIEPNRLKCHQSVFLFLCLFVCQHSLSDPLAQLPAGRVGVGGEDDQAPLGVVHVFGVTGTALPTLGQWVPGHPGCTEPFLRAEVGSNQHRCTHSSTPTPGALCESWASLPVTVRSLSTISICTVHSL